MTGEAGRVVCAGGTAICDAEGADVEGAVGVDGTVAVGAGDVGGVVAGAAGARSDVMDGVDGALDGCA